MIGPPLGSYLTNTNRSNIFQGKRENGMRTRNQVERVEGEILTNPVHPIFLLDKLASLSLSLTHYSYPCIKIFILCMIQKDTDYSIKWCLLLDHTPIILSHGKSMDMALSVGENIPLFPKYSCTYMTNN